METPQDLTVDEAAEMLRCNPETIRRLVRTEKLGSWRVGSRIRIPREEIETYRGRSNAR